MKVAIDKLTKNDHKRRHKNVSDQLITKLSTLAGIKIILTFNCVLRMLLF